MQTPGTEPENLDGYQYTKGLCQAEPDSGFSQIFEAPEGKTGNIHFCEFLVTDPVPKGEMMKFSVNKKYIGKTGESPE